MRVVLHNHGCNQQQGGKADLPQLAVGVAIVMVLMMVLMVVLMMVLMMVLMVLFGVAMAVCATMRAMFVVMVCHILSFFVFACKGKAKVLQLGCKVMGAFRVLTFMTGGNYSIKSIILTIYA